MEKKTRRTGGQSKPEPAKTEAAVMDAPKPQAKKQAPAFKRTVQENTSKVYQALKNKGPAFMIMSRKISVYDKSTDSLRTARYCPNENSIWMDEQSDNSRTEPIIFRDGFLTVRPDQPNLRNFLELHPSNVSNGGNEFKVIDTKSDAESVVKKEFEVFDAISMIKNSDTNDLLSVALYFKVDIDRQMSEIKHDLLIIAKKKPAAFIQAFDDPIVKCKATVKQALDYQVIKSRKDSVRWYDSNGIIVSVPHGQDAIDIMSRFCLTEKGASVLASIQDELDRLA